MPSSHCSICPRRRRRAYRWRIELAARRAAELTSQMLAYAGKGRMVIELFEMNTLVEEITALLEVSIAKTTTLRYMLAPQLPLIAVDATQIRQVIMNLVLNAAEAAGSTTSIIVITTGVLYVDRSYLARTWLAPELLEGQYVFLEIIDDGPGMSAETLAKIFDPFARLSSEAISAGHASKNTRSGAYNGGMIRAESAAASAAV